MNLIMSLSRVLLICFYVFSGNVIAGSEITNTPQGMTITDLNKVLSFITKDMNKTTQNPTFVEVVTKIDGSRSIQCAIPSVELLEGDGKYLGEKLCSTTFGMLFFLINRGMDQPVSGRTLVGYLKSLGIQNMSFKTKNLNYYYSFETILTNAK